MFHWHDYHKLDIVYKKLSHLVIMRGFTFRKERIQEEPAMVGAQLVVLQLDCFVANHLMIGCTAFLTPFCVVTCKV
jgi:hypothetical protein